MKPSSMGLIQAISAYLIWGLFPLYWIWLTHVPALEILAHRVVWSCAALTVGMLIYRRQFIIKQAISQPRTLLFLIITSVLISINWLVYIWAVSNSYVIEASMGYYINPLVNVLLGALFLRERLRRYQYLAVFLALIGVVIMTVTYGKLPLVTITLAMSFSLYALSRKFVTIDSQSALLIETVIVLFPALGYLCFGEHSYAILHDTWINRLLLMGGGLVTIVPLLLLSNALKTLPLSTVGLLQYMTPTMLFLSGIFLFNEPFTLSQAVSFSFIWLGVAVYSAEALWVRRRNKK